MLLHWVVKFASGLWEKWITAPKYSYTIAKLGSNRVDIETL